MIAAHTGDIDCVKSFIENGKADAHLLDVCGNSALYLALISEKKEVVEYLLQNTKGKNFPGIFFRLN